MQAEARKVLQAKAEQRLHDCVGAAEKSLMNPNVKCSINFISLYHCNIKPHFPTELLGFCCRNKIAQAANLCSLHVYGLQDPASLTESDGRTYATGAAWRRTCEEYKTGNFHNERKLFLAAAPENFLLTVKFSHFRKNKQFLLSESYKTSLLLMDHYVETCAILCNIQSQINDPIESMHPFLGKMEMWLQCGSKKKREDFINLTGAASSEIKP